MARVLIKFSAIRILVLSFVISLVVFWLTWSFLARPSLPIVQLLEREIQIEVDQARVLAVGTITAATVGKSFELTAEEALQASQVRLQNEDGCEERLLLQGHFQNPVGRRATVRLIQRSRYRQIFYGRQILCLHSSDCRLIVSREVLGQCRQPSDDFDQDNSKKNVRPGSASSYQ